MLMFATLQHCSRKHIIKKREREWGKIDGRESKESEIVKGGAEAPLLKRGHVRTATLRHCCNLCAACSSCLAHLCLSPVKWDRIIFNMKILDIFFQHTVYICFYIAFHILLLYIWHYSRHWLEVWVKCSPHHKAMHNFSFILRCIAVICWLRFIRLFIHRTEKGDQRGAVSTKSDETSVAMCSQCNQRESRVLEQITVWTDIRPALRPAQMWHASHNPERVRGGKRRKAITDIF